MQELPSPVLDCIIMPEITIPNPHNQPVRNTAPRPHSPQIICPSPGIKKEAIPAPAG